MTGTGVWPTGHPPERAPATTARALADLARAGYEVLDQPSMQVDYEIRHAADRPGGLAGIVGGLPADTVFAEILSSAANGAGMMVATRVGNAQAAGATRGRRSWLDLVEASDRSTGFRGSDRPNLTFRHESAAQFEGIISIENEPKKMLLRHGLAVLEALRFVAETGVQADDAPLLKLQCPAQLPAHTFQDTDDLGGRTVGAARSSSIAIRFALALDRPNADVRLQIADRLTRYCREKGLGLWLRDTRSGFREGNWFLVLAHDTPRARQNYPRGATVADRQGPGNGSPGCLPVTFVGPARSGSTHAILAFLTRFSQVGVLSCAMRPLGELTFLHLQLAVNGATRQRLAAVTAALPGIRAAGGGPHEVLTALAPHLLGQAGPAVAVDQDVARLIARAGDYRCAVGPALPVVADHVVRRIPVWVAWRIPRHAGGLGGVSPADGLGRPLLALHRAVQRLDLVDRGLPTAGAGVPSTEFLVCHQDGESFVRGKAKLAIAKDLVESRFAGPAAGSGAQRPESRLCEEVRSAWAAELAAAGHAGRPGELSVSPYESWLALG